MDDNEKSHGPPESGGGANDSFRQQPTSDFLHAGFDRKNENNSRNSQCKAAALNQNAILTEKSRLKKRKLDTVQMFQLPDNRQRKRTYTAYKGYPFGYTR